MTQFDFIVLGLLAISAIVGFVRGAVREIVALVALMAAAALAVLALPIASPFVRQIVQPPWLGAVAALALVFAATYIALRVIGGALSRSIRKTQVLGALDRSVGLAIGLARGMVVLGALNLMFNAATPPDLQPRWITGAMTWPTARNMGRLLVHLTPEGLNLADRFKPSLARAVEDGVRDRSATGSYDATRDGEPDEPLESTR